MQSSVLLQYKILLELCNDEQEDISIHERRIQEDKESNKQMTGRLRNCSSGFIGN